MLTTFNTPFGRYRFLRSPMGLKCSGEIFQMDVVTHFDSLVGEEIVIDYKLFTEKLWKNIHTESQRYWKSPDHRIEV